MLEMPSYGVDTKLFVRGTFTTYVTPFGLSIKVENYKKFGDAYSKAIKDALNDIGIKKTRLVYNSYLVRSLSGNPEDYPTFFDSFYNKILPEISEAKIYYTFFSKNVTSIWAPDGDKFKQFTTINFIKQHLNNSYPHICASKIGGNTIRDKEMIFIDDFQGYVTNSWVDLINQHNFSVVINGDLSNFCVATSDLLLTAIDIKLMNNAHRIDEDSLKMVTKDFKDKIKLEFIGRISDLKPFRSILMSKEKYYAHPLILFIDEKNPYVLKKGIQISPMSDKLYDYACINGGCVKLFDRNSDPALIREGDFMVAIGETGKKAIEEFKTLGYPVKELDLAKL